MKLMNMVYVYLLAVNVAAFILYGADKRKAAKGKWRIPEATLIGFAAAGGGLGAFLGMRIWHHKTKKWKFRILVPLCLIAWILLIGFCVWNGYGRGESLSWMEGLSGRDAGPGKAEPGDQTGEAESGKAEPGDQTGEAESGKAESGNQTGEAESGKAEPGKQDGEQDPGKAEPQDQAGETAIKEDEGMTENIEVFAQSSIRITGSMGTIYVDSFQMKEEPKDADYIFITHDHYDHFSPEDIEKVISDHTVLVVPEGMEKTVKKEVSGYAELVTVKPGQTRTVNGLEFDTVAAYNLKKPFHRKSAGWVGYILKVDGRTIYIAGDTDATDEAKAVRCDIALVPIGGTYTMDAEKAAELVNAIQPEIAIPTHYGSVVGSPEDGKVFMEHVKAPVKVEMKLSF